MLLSLAAAAPSPLLLLLTKGGVRRDEGGVVARFPLLKVYQDASGAWLAKDSAHRKTPSAAWILNFPEASFLGLAGNAGMYAHYAARMADGSLVVKVKTTLIPSPDGSLDTASDVLSVC